MKSGIKYNLLDVDGKGRVHIPKGIREEMGIQNQVVVEREKDLLILRPIKTIGNPIEFLSKISVKTKKSPVEMKREAEGVFGG
ncbi:MAG TPA: AbrB/MazE/SpoVT family DNA-binding domain-containing protein [archaeon]|nr:AbrB/MazE/SpoVT family DNA-binding domain-containing protein [archaeon]